MDKFRFLVCFNSLYTGTFLMFSRRIETDTGRKCVNRTFNMWSPFKLYEINFFLLSSYIVEKSTNSNLISRNSGTVSVSFLIKLQFPFY